MNLEETPFYLGLKYRIIDNGGREFIGYYDGVDMILDKRYLRFLTEKGLPMRFNVSYNVSVIEEPVSMETPLYNIEPKVIMEDNKDRELKKHE